MPLDPAALEGLIAAKLASTPIGTYPKKTTISSTPAADGTVATTAVPEPAQMYLDPGISQAIAKAVATSVVAHLLSNAVVVGAGPTSGKIT